MTLPKITADDVVDRAEQLIDSEGLAALSVRRLASELGVSRQVVYTHFRGMHDVLDQLHLRSGRHLTDSVAELEAPVGTDDRLLAGAHAYVSFSRQRPAMFDLTFGRPVPGYVPSAQTTAALQDVFRVQIVGLIEQWCDANGIDIKPGAMLARARVYWSAIHGLVTLERAGHAAPTETDHLVENLVSSLIAGWRSTTVSVTRSPCDRFEQ